MNRIVIAVVATLATFHAGPAFAISTTDERLRQEAQETPTAGIVFMEVELVDQRSGKGKPCEGLLANVVSDQESSRSIIVRDAPNIIFDKYYGGGAALLPGTYTITRLGCIGGASFNGRFAQFHVRTGEVINLGRLFVDYVLVNFAKFSSRSRVGDLSPEAVQSLTKVAPVAFSKAIKRYMTPNPATSNPKK